MRPALIPGDMAVLRAEPLGSLAVGQVVAFHPPHEPKLTVLHRVVLMGEQAGQTVIRTKGDANAVMDPWHLQLHASRVWVMALRVPKVGYVAVWAHSRVVFMSAYATLVVLVVGLGLRRIWRRPAPVTAQAKARRPDKGRVPAKRSTKAPATLVTDAAWHVQRALVALSRPAEGTGQ